MAEEFKTVEEREAFFKKVMDELDEELAEHERYAEEYGRRRMGLTPEEIRQLDLQELGLSREFAEKMGMTIETLKMNDDE